jgi:hypothetical protein
MFDEEYAHKSAVRFLTMFQQAVHPAIIIQPTKRAFDFPALATVAFFSTVFRRTTQRLRDMVIAIRCNRHDSTLAQSAAMGFTIVAFIQAQALGPTAAAANPNTINRFQ